MRIGSGYIKENPARAAGIFALKFSEMWLGGIGRNPNISRHRVLRFDGVSFPLPVGLYLPVFFLGLLGFFFSDKETRQRTTPLAVLLVCCTVSYVAVTVAPNRYVLPGNDL